MSPRTLATAATTMLAAALTVAAGAQPPASDPASTARPDNYYAAGNALELTSPMGADVIVAGRQIDIKQRVAGDILAAGWRVVLSGPADDDVRIAAAQIAINAPVAGDVTLAGGDVTLGPEVRVGGRSYLTGNTVRVAGTFERELQIAGANVQISGEMRQPVRIIADTLDIRPGARILAGLSYKSPSEARIADGATVSGPISFERIEPRDAQRARELPTASSALFAIHLFLAGWLVILFVPRFEASVVERLRAHPGRSVLAGFVLLVTTPVAALLLIVSVLGLPLGVVLAASYAVALFAGVLTTAFYVGDVEVRLLNAGPTVTRGQHALLLIAGVATLAVLRALLGGIVVFASVLFGLGAVALWLYDAYAQPAAASA
jgi:hypothetical protein